MKREAEKNMTRPEDYDRKAKWHSQRKDTIGNQNISDSYHKTAMLKRKGVFDKMQDDMKSRPRVESTLDSRPQNAYGERLEVDDKGWPKGTEKWAFR